ncbi:DUF1850 domain-containing protein [Cytobacillus sp. S13-E01]|uniref:DUF1850 domain-containing protein n=1 Tax=Cytobacillus sp. S13-E01 TaxID=3031326 RepID=UPI0023D89545|nr:DUF1850 domain-containing protein [Cytobacillus sp. S13-E01]MDF0728474.1 DUF1850 domain-containing protein [Cytobacillus sp. S13-E01]
MNVKKYFKIAIPSAIIIMILFIPYKQVLSFSFQNTNNVLTYIPVDMRGKTFQIKFTHTIHLSDVVETYSIDSENTIHQTEFMYEDFNVGMPSNATGDEKFVEEDGKYYIKNMNRTFPFIDIKIAQTIPKHLVIYNGKEYSLLTNIEPGTWTRVQSKKISLWQLMKGVNMLE